MKSDYTSAATLPIKLLHNPIIQNGKIVPYHVTMTPTNVCNKNCPECFTYKRSRIKKLLLGEIENIVDELYGLGTRAISLSGGGEPDCHPQINEIIKYINSKKIDVALVTNGKNLNKIQDDTLNLLEWIRVSGTSSACADFKELELNMNKAPNSGWGLSYVLSKNEPKDYINLHKTIKFSSNPLISHLRVVSDMIHPDENRIPKARKFIRKSLDDSKVIWQERITNKLGNKKCLVPLLHPIIDADGNMQPCCGINIATNPPAYDFGVKTAFCNWKNYREYLEKQTKYDGTKCKICQYDKYNTILEMMVSKPKNKRFI